ncbi:MAG: hypothetical protein M0Z99_31180 [Betaproteobacteria bacterium]|nr:hypothetical protein [Betaproteobacteria bacterium]
MCKKKRSDVDETLDRALWCSTWSSDHPETVDSDHSRGHYRRARWVHGLMRRFRPRQASSGHVANRK